MTVTALKIKSPVDVEMIYSDLREEMGSLLDMRDWYKDYNVQAHKNEEAVAEAELTAAVFEAKRHCDCKSIKSAEIDKIVAAVRKATIATARRKKREEELNNYERKVTDCKQRADKAGITFPVGWFPE